MSFSDYQKFCLQDTFSLDVRCHSNVPLNLPQDLPVPRAGSLLGLDVCLVDPNGVAFCSLSTKSTL